MKNLIAIGDTIVVPEELNNGEKCIAEVKKIYNRFILLETKDGDKITIQISDLNKITGLIKDSSSETLEMEDDIISNI